jgi:hypothetical protein
MEDAKSDLLAAGSVYKAVLCAGPCEGWPHSVTAGALRSARAQSSGASRRRRRYLRGNAGSVRRLLGREAERFGMGPAVVLGQDLTEAAGPIHDSTVADLATGDRQLGNGDREAAGRRLAHLHP